MKHFLFLMILFSIIIVGCAKQETIVIYPPNNEQIDTPKDTPVLTVIQSVTAKSPYTGNILAGNKTPYIEFNTVDYDKAVVDGKLIFLYFYSDVIPWCKSEEPRILDAFNDMGSSRVIGFKVHYDDAIATEAEKQLASELKIEEAATKIILKNGTIMQRSSSTWERRAYAQQIFSYLD